MDGTRKLKQAVFEMFKLRREVHLLMDAPEAKSWRERRELMKYAVNKEYWRVIVRAMNQPRVTVGVSGAQFVEGATMNFTVIN